MKKRFIPALGGLTLVGALTLSGCGLIEQTLDAIKGDPIEEALVTVAPEPVWTADIQHASPQVAISQEANMAVTYFIKDDALMLGGFDLKDGSEKWAHPAGTGARPNGFGLDVITFVDNGEPFVINTLDPVDGPADETGRFERGHPSQVINVASGEIVATTGPDHWTGPKGLACLDTEKACMFSKRGDVVYTLSISSNGETVRDEALQKFPDFALVDRIDIDGSLFAETKDGIPIIGRSRDGEVEWTRPLSELGVPELERSTTTTGYKNLDIGTRFFKKDGTIVDERGDADAVTVTTRIIDIAPLKNSIGVYTTYALDAKTGETLWDTEGKICLDAPVMCSGESTIQEKGGQRDYLPSTQNVWRFDPMTGEKVWETEVEKMVLVDRQGWKVPSGSSIQLVNVAGNYQVLDDADGTLSTPTAEQVFKCAVPGPDFKAYKGSVPINGLTTWTGNQSVVGCSVEDDEIPVSEFSEAVVVTGSPRPFDAPEDWDVWDKQVRVVSTTEGLVAYEF